MRERKRERIMTAIEYLKAKARMTKDCSPEMCERCPLSRINNRINCSCSKLEFDFPLKAVEIVEKWEKLHTAKTRQSEFLKLFPDSETDRNGNIKICPKSLYSTYDCTAYDSCDKCREKYWSEEMANGTFN